MFLQNAVACCSILLWGGVSFAHAFESVQSQHGFNTYEVGDMDLLLLSPHGGIDVPAIQPSNGSPWPDRTAGCYRSTGCVWEHGCYRVSTGCVWEHGCGRPNRNRCSILTVTDAFTKSITRDIADKIMELTDRRPHVVYVNLRRTKLDANRDVGEAALNVPDAVLAYNDFTDLVERARGSMSGQGLVIDVHGHSHPIQRIELGYMISSAQLNYGEYFPNMSSIRFNGLKLCSGDNAECFSSIVAGNRSLGHFLNNEGVNTVPSPNDQRPERTLYFSGAYNTETYGSLNGGLVDAIMMQLPLGMRMNFDPYLERVSKAIICYFKLHYDNAIQTDCAD